MNRNNRLTIQFMDGTNTAFDFCDDALDMGVKQVKFKEFLESPYLIVQTEEAVMAFAVANIRSVEMPMSTEGPQIGLPAHAIRGARVVR